MPSSAIITFPTWNAVGVARLAGEEGEGEPRGGAVEQVHQGVLHQGGLPTRDGVAEGGGTLPLAPTTAHPAHHTVFTAPALNYLI